MRSENLVESSPAVWYLLAIDISAMEKGLLIPWNPPSGVHGRGIRESSNLAQIPRNYVLFFLPFCFLISADHLRILTAWPISSISGSDSRLLFPKNKNTRSSYYLHTGANTPETEVHTGFNQSQLQWSPSHVIPEGESESRCWTSQMQWQTHRDNCQ